MRIRKGLEVKEICGEHIVMAEGMENVDFSKIVSLNESAYLLWTELAGKDFSELDMVRILLDNYEVDEHVAEADVKELVAKWKKEGIIEA